MNLTARMRKKKWQLAEPAPNAEALAKDLSIAPVLAQVLIRAGDDESVEVGFRHFLSHKLKALLNEFAHS